MAIKLRASALTIAFLTTIGFVLSQNTTVSVQAVEPDESMSKNANMIYFVMIDRFANGDLSNDHGGMSGGASIDGFNPKDTGFYHGGDLAGLKSKIPYIKSLGFTAIWVTPVVRQLAVARDGSGAAYHGYWGAGFDQVDSHLGTMAEFKDFVSSAHESGLQVVLDIVVNHTADVIKLQRSWEYVPLEQKPYLALSGSTYKPFNVETLSGSPNFPTLDQLSETESFPKVPSVPVGLENIKSPAWLNDLKNYHNRGDSMFQGESSLFGDFYGLDDTFTESPTVVKGWTDVFTDWIRDTDIDGFRIDTARHVNPKFWKAFLPAMRTEALSKNKEYFPMWAEAFDSDPSATSYWVKNANFSEMLDFPFQDRIMSFIQGQRSGNALALLFNSDDLYTTATSNADKQITFLGNHDMGRVGMFINNAFPNRKVALARDQMAHAMLFTLRGNPAVYYGDEFGLTGGGDKAARQDLFPTQVTDWQSQNRIGTPSIAGASSFETTNPLQDTIQSLTQLRKTYPVFSTGSQVIRYAGDGIFIFSRFDAKDGHEYVAAFNSATSGGSYWLPGATISLGTHRTTWTRLLGAGQVKSVTSTKEKISIAPGTWGVFKATQKVKSDPKISISLSKPTSDSSDHSQLKLVSRTSNSAFSSVEFFARAKGKSWFSLGTDSSPTFSNDSDASQGGQYRVFPSKSQFSKGASYEFKAVAHGVGPVLATSAVSTLAKVR